MPLHLIPIAVELVVVGAELWGMSGQRDDTGPAPVVKLTEEQVHAAQEAKPKVSRAINYQSSLQVHQDPMDPARQLLNSLAGMLIVLEKATSGASRDEVLEAGNGVYTAIYRACNQGGYLSQDAVLPPRASDGDVIGDAFSAYSKFVETLKFSSSFT